LTRRRESWKDSSREIKSLQEYELSTSLEQEIDVYIKSDNYLVRETDAIVSNTKSKEPLLSWLNWQNKSVPIPFCPLFQKREPLHDNNEGGYS
jgi:hypothetical protein